MLHVVAKRSTHLFTVAIFNTGFNLLCYPYLFVATCFFSQYWVKGTV